MHRLNDHDRILLRLKQRTERDKQRYVRITTMLMLHDGYSPSEVAEALGIDASTVHRYVHRFTERGDIEAYLQNDFRGSTAALSDAQIMQLCDELNDRLYRNSAEVREYIRRTFGLKYTRRHVRRLLKSLGFSFKKTTSVPAKADPLEQERFLREELEPLLRRTHERSEPLYFCDASHPEHNTRPAYGWIARGYRFCIETTSGRHRVNLTAALNVHDPRDVACLQAKRIDAISTIALFEELEARHPEGLIYVVCDNARYYRCEQVFAWLRDHRVVVLYLPPYSPNLNLIERLWKYLRQVVLDTTYYETLDEFRAAITDFFDRISAHVDKISTLMQPNFHIELGLAD